MTDQQKGRSQIRFHGGVGGRRESGGVRRVEQGGGGSDLTQPLGQVRFAGAINHHDVETGVVLCDKAVDGFLEPLTGLMGDHDSRHRRGGRPRFGSRFGVWARWFIDGVHDRRRLPLNLNDDGTPLGLESPLMDQPLLNF